jgi:sterol desaturase/sphingolipid hydroxylase (fatty acid hydroxylase superfamily)
MESDRRGFAGELALYLVFPGVLAVALAAAIAISRSGWPQDFVMAGAFVVGMGQLMLLERWIPDRRDWTGRDPQLPNDLGHTLIGVVLGGALQQLLMSLTWYRLAAALEGTLSSDLWPTGWSLPVQVCFAVVLGEFGSYWHHRLMHAWPPYWRCHVLHHSARRIHALTSVRQNVFDVGFFGPFAFGPLLLLGIPAETLSWYAIAGMVTGLLSHANVEQRNPRWFERLFGVALAHRLHHAVDPRLAHCNFGATVLIWDHIFGTYVDPRRVDPPVAGIYEPFPDGFWRQLAFPFWRSEETRPTG